LPRKVEKYYQNRYAFRQEFILLRKITATRVAVLLQGLYSGTAMPVAVKSSV